MYFRAQNHSSFGLFKKATTFATCKIYIIKMEKLIKNISVDCVIFGFNSKTLQVLLTERILKDEKTGEILISDYTLQGHHVLVGENLDDAARRVLKEKTGLDNIYLEQYYTFGNVNRKSNPKDQLWVRTRYPEISDHVISVGYFSLVNSALVKPDHGHEFTQWFPVEELPPLAFDHETIIQKALEALRFKLWREPIGFELLPEKFTLTQLQSLYEAVLGIKLDRRNFRKKVSQMKHIILMDDHKKRSSPNNPQNYFFSREVYEKTRKARLDFTI